LHRERPTAWVILIVVDVLLVGLGVYGAILFSTHWPKEAQGWRLIGFFTLASAFVSLAFTNLFATGFSRFKDWLTWWFSVRCLVIQLMVLAGTVFLALNGWGLAIYQSKDWFYRSSIMCLPSILGSVMIIGFYFYSLTDTTPLPVSDNVIPFPATDKKISSLHLVD
jgi:hypothetical protein